MEILLAIAITILFCAFCLFMYLAHFNNMKVLESNEKIRRLNEEICRLNEENRSLREKPIEYLTDNNTDEIQKLAERLREKDKEILKLNAIMNEEKTKALRIKGILDERDKEIRKLVKTLQEKDKEIIKLREPVSTPPTKKRFVQVIFKEGDEKRYDYLLGDIHDLKVNDFVLVPIRKSKERLDKEIERMIIELEIAGKPGEKPRKTTYLRAKVKYISKFGEISEYAKSEVIKKLDKKTW